MEELKEELQYIINKYGVNSIEAYDMSIRLSIEIDKVYNNATTIESYYNNSYKALTEYIQLSETNPTEVMWNRHAIKNRYLSSETMGYIDGEGFNKLCKKIRKKIKRKLKKELKKK